MNLQNRYDFVLLFDVKDGNPNGDPDAGNLPRMDAGTGCGLVTDVCLKRKVRNYVGLVKEEQPPYEIYVKEKAVLNAQHRRAYDDSSIKAAELDNIRIDEINKDLQKLKKIKDLKEEDKEKIKKLEDEKNSLKKNDVEELAKIWMCGNFFDVRTFGAVMSTGDKKAGQVRGPVQITFARSVDPIIANEHSITVCAARKEDKPIEEQVGIQGRKFTVPYGLYVTHGFISANLAGQTGFSEDDLELFWQALENMFEHDRSAARGEMTTRGLYVFKHESKLGNAPAHSLFERIRPAVKAEVTVPRTFGDYEVAVDKSNMPSSVELICRIG